jgi:UDP-N-acetylglucosamine acyltransferase
LDIHPTAVVHPQANIAAGVKIGAYSLVGENVRIGSGTVIEPHVVVEGPSEIGERCHIFSFASIGAAPQHLRYRGEPTRLVIGNENVIREFVTVNRGTVEGGGETVLGQGNFIMAYSHIAHDCRVGNQVILANAATLAGHIEVEDFAIIGGLVAIHQFVRVGCYAYRIIFRSQITLTKAMERVQAEVPELPEIRHLLDFLKSSKRGVCR